MSNIMGFFPYETPRDSQTKVLTKVEKNWNKYEVFVVRVPVAGGKSAIATTIQDWSLSHKASAAITVPNNMLRDQYMEEFEWLHTLRAQTDYWLERYDCTVKEYMKRHRLKFGPKGCEYNEDKKLVKRVGTPVVMNFMGYQAHKLFRNVMIVDEAHQLLPVLQSIHAKRIWRHIHGYPQNARSVSDILLWLEGMSTLTAPLAKLKKDISSLTPATTVEFGTDYYRGQEMDCIRLLPMDVSNEAPIFWPAKTKKLVLMSATISETDVNNMGLGTRKVCYIDATSEIPEAQRPILYTPVGSMSRKNKGETLPLLLTEIERVLGDNPGRKGFIHVTYELGSTIKDATDNPRLIFHNKGNKKEQFAKFLAMPPESGAVFVGSGMAEGIDLKYDAGYFQLITKIPFKSLVNPCYRYLATHRPKDYIWLTSKDILQASGRICRTPEDFGATYILDQDFDLWFERAKSYGHIPDWFRPIQNNT
jgi:Rad3-related DNA helicase